MFSKKVIVWLCIVCLIVIGGGIWISKDSKQVKKVLNQVNVFDKTAQKKKVVSDQKKPSLQNDVATPFTTTIQSKAVFNPNNVSFSIDTLSREEADKEADQALKMIGDVVPQEFINRDPDGLIANYKQMLTQLLPDISDETRKQLLDNHTLNQYQGEMLVKQSHEGKISWQAMQVASWKTVRQLDADMQAILSDNEYLRMMGSSKSDSVIRQVPHPYDDPEGKVWKQTEIFQNFSVPKATNGMITTEEQLYEYINPDTIAEAMKINKTMEYDHYVLSEQLQNGELKSEEFNQKWDASLEEAKQQMRSILTPEEGQILGLESWWSKNQ